MDRLEYLRDAVRSLLDSGQVDGVLALRAEGPASTPHLYHAGDDLDDLVLWPKYNLPKTLDMLLDASAEDGLVLGDQLIGDTFHLLSDVDVARIGPGTAARVALLFTAGQPDLDHPRQVHLVALGHFDEATFLTAAGHHAEHEPILRGGIQQHIQGLGQIVLGP